MDAPLKPPFSFRSVPAITCCRVHVESSKGRWTMLLNLHSPHRRSATRFSLLVLVIVVVFVFSLPNFAQVGVSTGSVLGTVTDPSGAVISGAKVTITNKSTGQTITTTTSSAGTYTSGALIPADY